MPPRFLDVKDVIETHAEQIALYGGSLGIRDEGLLESAVAAPQSGFGDQYFHESLYEMAAAYLFHLAKNHAFVDGNKRIALASAYLFLALNDVEISADENEIAEIVLSVARGELSKSEVAVYLKTIATTALPPA